MQGTLRIYFRSHTIHYVDVISPWSPFATSTPIRPPILPVGYASSRTSSTPPLMLYSENSVTKPHCNQSTFHNGVFSSSIVILHQWVSPIHLWNCSAMRVSETSNGAN